MYTKIGSLLIKVFQIIIALNFYVIMSVSIYFVVSCSLKENKDKSECYTILQWFYHLTKEKGEIFLTIPHHHGDETLGHSQIKSDSEEEKISFGR